MMRCVQISDAAALSNQPDLTQLGNTTYLMEAFEKLVNDLENPILLLPAVAQCSHTPLASSTLPPQVSLKPPVFHPLPKNA